jgi:hypothetical protein
MKIQLGNPIIELSDEDHTIEVIVQKCNSTKDFTLQFTGHPLPNYPRPLPFYLRVKTKDLREKPNGEYLIDLIEILETKQIVGRALEIVIERLFCDLFFPSEQCKKHLPELYNLYKVAYENKNTIVSLS